jgi:hypothetical protein
MTDLYHFDKDDNYRGRTSHTPPGGCGSVLGLLILGGVLYLLFGGMGMFIFLVLTVIGMVGLPFMRK